MSCRRRSSPTRSTGSSIRSRSTQPAELLLRQLQVRRLHGVADGLRPARARDRDDHGREREHPGEADLLRADAVRLRDLLERHETGTEVARLADAAERAPRQEGDAQLVAELQLRTAR